MFIGHFALAFAGKRAAQKTSLGTLFLSVQLVDLLWPLFLFVGLEHVRVDPGNTSFTPLDFYDYPLTHSLAATVIWAALFGAVYLLLRRYRRGAWVVGLGVLSHWILDFLTHRPDLPLAPGSVLFLGLGLWNSVPGTLIIELGLFALGIVLYLRSTKPRDRIGVYALWALIAFLLLVYAGNTFGPPPPDEATLAIVGNAGWLFVLWAYWVDRHRGPIEELNQPTRA